MVAERPFDRSDLTVAQLKRFASEIESSLWQNMLLFVVTCALLLAAPVQSKGIDQLEPIGRQRNVSAIACIFELCEKYYHSDRQIIGALLVVHIQNTTPFHDTLMKTLMDRNTYSISLINQYKSYNLRHFNITEKAKNYFVAFREYDEVTAALRVWTELPTWNPLAKFVAVFMNKYDADVLYAQIRFILETFYRAHVLNVKVISFRRDDDVIQMHTWYPYEGTNCAEEVRNIHLIDECHYSDSREGAQDVRSVQTLQPIIPANLHGCPLRIACSTYEPFVHYYDSAQNDATLKSGIEIRLVRSIARALEMTPVFIHINETRDNRNISTESGIYSLVLRRCDFLHLVGDWLS